jgi:hypothetical protein
MSYHSVQLMLAAFDQWRRAIEDSKRPNALTMDSISSVVLAAARTEGFTNELAEYVDTYRRIRSELIPEAEQKEKLNRVAAVVLDPEKRQRPVTEKYGARR